MQEPIIKFNSEAEATECMRWWQHQLYLDDWILRLRIIPFSESPLDGQYMGHNIADHVNNGAMIYLARHDDLDPDVIMTLCDEKVLVHELLHLSYPSLVDATNYTSAFMDMEQHRQLEKMAKSLVLTKYGLPREWFDRHWHDEYIRKENSKSCIRKAPKN